MDFPGPITIGWDTFTRYCTDVGTSLARHGFRRMLFLNGHGSNQNFVEAAARLVGVEHPGVLAAAAFYLSGKASLARVGELRESERGGMGHACELETSIYLAIDPDAVDMDEGGGRARLPRRGVRLHGLGGRAAEGDALVVVVLGDRRAGRRDEGDRREGRWRCSRPPSRSASASSASCSPGRCPSGASRGRPCDAAADPADPRPRNASGGGPRASVRQQPGT